MDRFPEVMRRRLVKQGPSTLTVSLPSTWVRANRLEPGTEVQVAIQQNSIIVSPENGEDPGENITLDIRERTVPFLNLLFSSIHKKGYEEVRILCERSQLAYVENRVTKQLLGYEIVQQTSESITIRFVTKIDKEELPALVRRAFLVTIALAEGTLEQPENAHDLLTLEETNNRLTNYCERIIIKHLHQQANPIFEYIIVWLLEKIADEYRDVIRKKRLNAEAGDVCLRMLKQFYELYYRYSFAKHDQFVLELAEATEQLEGNSSYAAILHALAQTGGSLVGMHLE